MVFEHIHAEKKPTTQQSWMDFHVTHIFACCSIARSDCSLDLRFNEIRFSHFWLLYSCDKNKNKNPPTSIQRESKKKKIRLKIKMYTYTMQSNVPYRFTPISILPLKLVLVSSKCNRCALKRENFTANSKRTRQAYTKKTASIHYSNKAIDLYFSIFQWCVQKKRSRNVCYRLHEMLIFTRTRTVLACVLCEQMRFLVWAFFGIFPYLVNQNKIALKHIWTEFVHWNAAIWEQTARVTMAKRKFHLSDMHEREKKQTLF